MGMQSHSHMDVSFQFPTRGKGAHSNPGMFDVELVCKAHLVRAATLTPSIARAH